MENYQLGKRIASGAFGVVFTATEKQGGRSVAVKQVYRSDIVDREIEIMRNLGTHPNVCECYEVVQTSSFERSIVMERGEHDLEALIDSWEYPVREALIQTISRGILEGLCHIHARNIMHRDLKPSNIVVKQGLCTVFLCDFGSATAFKSGQELPIQGFTRWYKCPQMLFGSRNYGPEVDIWSLGCILMEVAIGRPLFGGKTELEQISLISTLLGDPSVRNWPQVAKLHDFGKIQFVEREPKSSETICADYKITATLWNFLSRMIRYQERPSASQLLKDPFLHQDFGEKITLELGPLSGMKTCLFR